MTLTSTLPSVRMEGKVRDTYTSTTLCENGRQSLCHIDTSLRGWKSAVLTQTDRHAHTDTYSGTQTHTVAQNYTNQKGPSTMTLLVSHTQRIARRPTPTPCLDPYWVYSWCNESGQLQAGFLNRWLPFFRQ